MSVTVQSLTAKAFAPFGDVIETGPGIKQFDINQGLTRRFHDLAHIDTSAEDGKVGVSIFRSTPMNMPLKIKLMERHPLSSQAFVPLSQNPYLVVVAPAGEFNPDAIEFFLAQPNQGVNYRTGTWHHFSLALKQQSDFLVIDRIGAGDNCDEVALFHPITVTEKDLQF